MRDDIEGIEEASPKYSIVLVGYVHYVEDDVLHAGVLAEAERYRQLDLA